MIYELETRHYKVRPAIAELAQFNFSIPALLDGVNPGTIKVDDLDNPKSFYIHTVEGRYLAGDAAADTFIQALNAEFRERYFNDEVTVEGDAMGFVAASDRWSAKMAELCHPRTVFTVQRRHYVCTELAYSAWRERLSDGYDVRRINLDLLNSDDLEIPGHIPHWIKWNWGTCEHFMIHGFGFCTIHENKIVSWCIADCTSGTQCEIGIHTAPHYRRRGLASATAAAAVEYALNNGFIEVGWHCNDDNVGSWKTAEKVGFKQTRSYLDHYCMFSSVHETAERGHRAFNVGNYQDCADAYSQVFALGDDFPDYIYHLAARAYAAIDNKEQALHYLNMAIDRNWTAREQTENCAEFQTLQGMDGWQAALDRMETQA